MRKPSEIAEIIRIEARADAVSEEQVGGAGRNPESRYRYEAVFTRRVVIGRIKDKVERIEDNEGLSLKVTGIEPRLRETEDSLQAGFSITITETENRAKVENEDLTTFGDNIEHTEDD